MVSQLRVHTCEQKVRKWSPLQHTRRHAHIHTHTLKAVPLSPKCPCSVLKVPTSHCCLQAKRIKVRNTNLACTLVIKTVPPDQIKNTVTKTTGRKCPLNTIGNRTNQTLALHLGTQSPQESPQRDHKSSRSSLGAA